MVLKFLLWLSTFTEYIDIVAGDRILFISFLFPYKCSFERSFSADEVLQLLGQFFNLEMLVIVPENYPMFLTISSSFKIRWVVKNYDGLF